MWNRFTVQKKGQLKDDPEKEEPKVFPLHKYCQFDRVRDIQRVVQEHPKLIFEQDELGNTPLHYLVHLPKINTQTMVSIRLLLDRGAKVSFIYNHLGLSVLHYAIKPGNQELIGLLLSLKGNLEEDVQQRTGYTSLVIAIVSGFFEIVTYLVEVEGADINNCGKNSLTPFQAACSQGHLDIMCYLVNQGVDVTTLVNQETPILNKVVLSWRYLPVAIYLIEHLGIHPFTVYPGSDESSMDVVARIQHAFMNRSSTFFDEYKSYVAHHFEEDYHIWLDSLIDEKGEQVLSEQDRKHRIRQQQQQQAQQKEQHKEIQRPPIVETTCHVCGQTSIIPHNYKICNICLKDVQLLLKHNTVDSTERRLKQIYCDDANANASSSTTDRHRRLLSKFIAKSPDLIPVQKVVTHPKALFSRFIVRKKYSTPKALLFYSERDDDDDDEEKEPVIDPSALGPSEMLAFSSKHDHFKKFKKKKKPMTFAEEILLYPGYAHLKPIFENFNLYAHETKPQRRLNYPPLEYYEDVYANEANQSLYYHDIVLKRQAKLDHNPPPI